MLNFKSSHYLPKYFIYFWKDCEINIKSQESKKTIRNYFGQDKTFSVVTCYFVPISEVANMPFQWKTIDLSSGANEMK